MHFRIKTIFLNYIFISLKIHQIKLNLNAVHPDYLEILKILHVEIQLSNSVSNLLVNLIVKASKILNLKICNIYHYYVYSTNNSYNHIYTYSLYNRYDIIKTI
jgi:hypothetical protein